MSRTTPLGAPAFWPAPSARPRSGEPESRLVLASGSPRRRELLESLDLDFTVRPAAVDETPNPGERPRDLVRRLAREKAEAAGRDGEWVLAADTIVVENGDILGKPKDRDQAREMLHRLRGRWHLVLTGVALKPPNGDTLHAVESTRVLFAELTPEQIDWYAATGEPDDKAGAYAVQGLGSLFVLEIDGNYSNVVGLPLPTVRQLFEGAGSDVRAFRR
ncbi:MAG: Maf family protein [Acidobacteria bacterium]|nr:Maf family protein [Acidobacteriota bacterium]